MIKNWFKIAFKNYRKNWMATLINIFGLTVGMTGLILMLLYWNYENSFEQWNPNKENVYVLENQMDGLGTMIMSNYMQAKHFPELFDEIEEYSIGTFWQDNVMLKNGSKTSYAISGFATEQVFELFPFERVVGKLDDALKDEESIVLSEKTAKELFGDEYKNAIGKLVENDDEEKSFIVKGIYRLPKENSVIKPEFMIRQPALWENYNQNWTNFNLITFFKIKSGTDIPTLEAKLTNKQRDEARKNAAEWNMPFTNEESEAINLYLTRLDKMKLFAQSSGINKGDLKNLKILMSLAVLIVLLSAINFINLKTAQAASRAKEVGVRKSLGSTKAKLIWQFLFEAFIVCFFSFLLSIGLAELLIPSFNKFSGLHIQFDDVNILLYLFVGLIVLVLISGLIPALYISNFKPINTLKGNFSRSAHGKWLRNGILTLQIVISSFFIIGSLIINAQLRHMLSKDLGFHGKQVMHIDFHKVNGDNEKKYNILKNTLRNYSGVEDVTFGAQRIGKWISMSTRIQNKDSTENYQVAMGAIDTNYMKFFDIKLIAGRDFDTKMTADTTVNIIINQSLANSLGKSPEDAINKEVRTDGFDEIHKFYKVIGVVQDFHISGVNVDVSPTLYFNYDRIWTKNNMNGVDIKIKPNNIENTVAQIQDFWQTKIEPGYPFDYYFVDKEFAKTFEKYQKQRTLFGILNAVVLIVALLGLFALSALLIEQKLKTVAIKKTLGASDGTLIFGLTKQFLIITAIAVLISIPISYYFMNEWLKDFAYRIEMPWWPYVLSLLVLLFLTFMVVSFKAYRATKISLVKYLKYE